MPNSNCTVATAMRTTARRGQQGRGGVEPPHAHSEHSDEHQHDYRKGYV